MSGPSLHKLTAHKSIHDGAVSEGRDLLEIVEKLHQKGNKKQAKIAADALVEHWETRTITHADAEEDGFYKSKLEENPEMELTLAMLKRDHALLRILIADIKQSLSEQNNVNQEVIDRFRAIYVLVQIHNRDEEQLLLTNDFS
ncbi:hemerythrin domain-containing protein [Calidifontibacillus oryziterrae]|uniref:hemerythrin domain-containing protein n=1 Tax=Calidifontibacillus oryziterrae TaxID=1191699 RepID=UPI00031F6AFB|nr:hemerythrin domain-containing protein [Calidifontibacillus oryziterrae]